MLGRRAHGTSNKSYSPASPLAVLCCAVGQNGFHTTISDGMWTLANCKCGPGNQCFIHDVWPIHQQKLSYKRFPRDDLRWTMDKCNAYGRRDSNQIEDAPTPTKNVITATNINEVKR